MAIGFVLDPVQVQVQQRRVEDVVEKIAGFLPTVQWRYSAYSSERLPLRAYASAVTGEGPEADELLILAVTWRSEKDEGRERLIVGADILDGGGCILGESPRIEIRVTGPAGIRGEEDWTASGIARDLEAAMRRMETWLISQVPTIQAVLGSAGVGA